MPIIKKGYTRRCVPVRATRSAADDTRAGRGSRGRDRDTERGDIREGGSGREGCGSTHRDRLNSRAARLFFQRSFLPPLAHPFAPRCDVLLQHCPRFPPGPRRSCSLVVFLFSTPLRAVPSLRSPFSALLLLHQRWQPAYRQSSFSILRGAARLRHLLSLCPSRASSCPSATSAFCRFSLFFFFFILFKMRGPVKKT